mgnify:CR=1 FL=1
MEFPATIPARSIEGRVVALFRTPDPTSFETAPVERLDLALTGIEADRHAGFVRSSTGREPWYRRGTPVRNDRQLSILSREEMAIVAARLGLDELLGGWVGANLLLEGIPSLSFLPRGTRLFVEDAAVIQVEAPNAPCRIAGRNIAKHTGRQELELGFPREAMHLRGVVASVERAGAVHPGDRVVAKVPEQWLYTH